MEHQIDIKKTFYHAHFLNINVHFTEAIQLELFYMIFPHNVCTKILDNKELKICAHIKQIVLAT